jgi:O-antigen ligase
LKVQQKAVLLAGIAYFGIALLHIPDRLFRYIFDKNAPVQFLSLILSASIYAIYIAIKNHRFKFYKTASYGILALVVTLFASLLMSGDLTGSLIGESGRFVGVASTIALVVVSIFHSQFKYEAFLTLAMLYVAAIEAVVLIGIAQRFGFVTLPGTSGVSSTLGNIDFFAAYVGTTLPLIFLLFIESGRKTRIALSVAAAINVYSLYLAGPLQGYLDVAFVIVGLVAFVLRKRIPRPSWSLNVRTYIGTFAVVIWAEFIFLMPFLGDFIPVLGNDVQVKIRSNFWLAGMRQFFSHPILGVGPDQYGNYYEQYRTLEDIQKYSNILSNDAHSASVQTLATLGIIGALVFVFLIALVVRSLLILWDENRINRRALFALGLFIFIYLTNSFISPITLSHKYLFWAVCGFIVGQVYRKPALKTLKSSTAILSGGVVVVSLIAIALTFAQAQLNFINYVENFAAGKPIPIQYKNSSLLPCNMYFEAELQVAKHVSEEAATNLSYSEITNHQRCVSAQIVITRLAVNSGKLDNLKSLAYKLYEIAPARSDSLSLGMYYANRSGDLAFKSQLEKTMKTLGFFYIPGKLG